MSNKICDDIIKNIISYNYEPLFCVLGDCSKETCHHCFPVKNCKEHEICKKEGQFEEMSTFIFKKVCCKN